MGFLYFFSDFCGRFLRIYFFFLELTCADSLYTAFLAFKTKFSFLSSIFKNKSAHFQENATKSLYTQQTLLQY